MTTTLTGRPGLPAPLAPAAGCYPALQLAAAATLIAGLLLAAGYVAISVPYTAGSTLGYNLGLVGGVLMLLLLPYSLRKRMRGLRQCGTMRAWFVFHIFAGLMGPLLILFHSTFRIGSFNGGIALASTLLVALSGTVGRYFYRRVYRGLSGRRSTLAELQAHLTQEMARLTPQLERLTSISTEIERYLARAASLPSGRWPRLVHLLTLGSDRRVALRRIRRTLAVPGPVTACEVSGQIELLPAIAETLAAAQRAAQFSTYERLFALWHVIHVPFLYLLVLTSAVHVVAVHAY